VNKVFEKEIPMSANDKVITKENNDPRKAESLEEQLDHVAEELITGDSDDPPLSEEAVVEMLKVTHVPKSSALS
jgi:hypothetical protein